jgi:DNA primase
MPKSSFVNFKAVKAAITMEQVLQHYGLLDKFKRIGDSLSGPCPIHKGTNPTQFRVSLSKNIWKCFSECHHGGNVLDFIVKMEDVSIHAAALKAVEWFKLDPDSMSADQEQDTEDTPGEKPEKASSSPSKPAVKTPAAAEEKSAPNPVLKFKLDKLDRNHPYLAERGLTSKTIEEFEVGFCAKGMMADRIAIPIRNAAGFIVAYVGRLPGEPTGDTPKYKLPQGFRKSLELFNFDRAIREPAEKPLVIVEGFFDCMKLHQEGYRKVVALMGSTMSTAQEELIRKHASSTSQIVVLLDEDDAGRAGRDDIACRLAKHCFVRVFPFGVADTQPEHLSADELRGIMGGEL